MNTDNSNFVEICKLAIFHHEAGRFQQAEHLYRQILKIDPNNAEIIHLLGVLVDQVGDHESAVKLISKAIDINPVQSEFHDNLGIAQRALGQFEAAIASHKRALELNQNSLVSHHNLGVTLEALNRLDEAIDSYRQAISISPMSTKSYVNLGIALAKRGDTKEAIELQKKALTINENDAGILSGLGNILHARGDYTEATKYFERAIKSEPNNPIAHCSLGITLRTLGRLDEAISCYRRAIDLSPDHPEIYKVLSNLGNALGLKGALDDAFDCYKKSLSRKEDYPDAYVNLGVTEQQRGNIDDAKSAFLKAISLKPDHNEAYLKLLCSMCYTASESEMDLHFSAHKKFGELFASSRYSVLGSTNNTPVQNRRLKIGYLSSDFHSHPVGHNIRTLFEHRDRDNYETYCYAELSTSDWMTDLFRKHTDVWRSTVGFSDLDVAKMIRSDKIDILVLLAGHFDGNRLLVGAYKPSPIQVSFHDIATSGTTAIEYFVTDSVLHPEDTSEKFTEELYRLPFFYNRAPLENVPSVSEPPHKTRGYITFGSFNNPAKINQKTIELWSSVLHAVSGSRMLLKYKNWYANRSIKNRCLKLFSSMGVAGDRISFIDSGTSTNDYLDNYRNIDIALDTYPFTGATTTFDTLWMGVPVVTLAGSTFPSRYSAALLIHTGLHELVASKDIDYVKMAVQLACDSDRLNEIRNKLREKVSNSPLCNGENYARSIEAMYVDIWKRWCSSGASR
ncbi:MAG: tetratricopeptide repeat protein [Proteobacteria bacterium]|nr:tetratricopeptide repeat protein [Pseudomonadota bacterium]